MRASRSASARPAKRSSGVARAIATARSASAVHAFARRVVGGDHRLPAPDQDAQAHVVAFGALGFLDRAVAHLDRPSETERMATASAASAPACARGLHQPFGQRGQGGLVKKGVH